MTDAEDITPPHGTPVISPHVPDTAPVRDGHHAPDVPIVNAEWDGLRSAIPPTLDRDIEAARTLETLAGRNWRQDIAWAVHLRKRFLGHKDTLVAVLHDQPNDHGIAEKLREVMRLLGRPIHMPLTTIPPGWPETLYLVVSTEATTGVPLNWNGSGWAGRAGKVYLLLTGEEDQDHARP